jgi:hypothetical protein
MGYQGYEPDEYDEYEEEPEEKKRKGGILFRILAILAVLLLLTSAGLIAYQYLVTPPGTFRDMDGNLVAPENPEDMTEEAIQEMDPEVQLGTWRFVVPDVDLDAPLGAMNTYKGVINPPGYTSVYWIRNMGVSLENAGSGTVYMATHSLRHGGRGPGNYLIDVEKGEGKVPIGAAMYAKADTEQVKYRVTDVISVPKSDIGTVNVWDEAVPGRIVIVTCLQRPDNSASRNNIIVVGILEELYQEGVSAVGSPAEPEVQ